MDRSYFENGDITLYTKQFDKIENAGIVNLGNIFVRYNAKSRQILEIDGKIYESGNCFERAKKVLYALKFIQNSGIVVYDNKMLNNIIDNTYYMLISEIVRGCNNMVGSTLYEEYIKYNYPHIHPTVKPLLCVNKKLEVALNIDAEHLPLSKFIEKWQVYKCVYENKFRKEIKQLILKENMNEQKRQLKSQTNTKEQKKIYKQKIAEIKENQKQVNQKLKFRQI